MTTRSGRVVKQAESYKDADYSYTQSDFGDFAFSESRNADKVKVLKYEDEVANYIELLTAFEGSDDYVDYIKAKQFTQYSIKKGLKEFPDEGKQSIIKEMNNMTCRKVFGEVVYESLTAQQKKWALPILLFTVMKRNGTLKSRACKNGCQQRLWTNKEQVSSPTPSIDSLKYTIIVDA